MLCKMYIFASRVLCKMNDFIIVDTVEYLMKRGSL